MSKVKIVTATYWNKNYAPDTDGLLNKTVFAIPSAYMDGKECDEITKGELAALKERIKKEGEERRRDWYDRHNIQNRFKALK